MPEKLLQFVGIKETTTGDTICDSDHQIVLESISFPEPVISLAIEPATKSDQEKMGLALGKLSDEDPTLELKVIPRLVKPLFPEWRTSTGSTG